MSSPSLPGLANELVIQIFKLLPNCRAVAASNRTSRKFYQIWLSDAAAISDAVLPRVIDCYAEVEELVRFQTAQEQEWEAETSGTDGAETDGADDAYQKVLKRNKRFAANASMISKECRDLQVGAYSQSDPQGPDGEELRRARFLYLAQTRYRIHCVVALSNDRAAQDRYLEATSLLDLKDMRDKSIWSNPRHCYTDYEYFCIYLKTRTARDPFDLIEHAFYDKLRAGNPI